MKSKMHFIVHLLVLLVVVQKSNPTGKCDSANDWTGKEVKLITFGSMKNCSSIFSTSQFAFNTDYSHSASCRLSAGKFCFRNIVPSYYSVPSPSDPWHKGATDHTTNTRDGCMYLVHVDRKDSKIFSFKADNLCIEKWYEFSAYLANFVNNKYPATDPNVRFEVWNVSSKYKLLAECETGNIKRTSALVWNAYGVRFQAMYSSVELLITSNTEADQVGNKHALDDIQLRTNETDGQIICPTGTNNMTSPNRTGSSTTTITTSSTTSDTTLKTASSTAFSTPPTTTSSTAFSTTPTTTSSTTSDTTLKTASSTAFSTPPTTTSSTAFSTTPTATSSTTSSTRQTTTKKAASERDVQFYQPVQCDDSTKIGDNCNTTNNPCAIIKPCENEGKYYNTINNKYYCKCRTGFNGTHCEFDHRLCKPNTCLNQGKCKIVSNSTFHCTCKPGWQGIRCRDKIDLCKTNPCQNKAICRTLFLNYSCECLGNDFSGRHCEIISTKVFILNIVSKSFAYVAILAICSVIIFIVIMDILKYCFGIDPVEDERERMRRERGRKQLIRRHN